MSTANYNTLVVLGTAHLSSTPGKCSPDKTFREYIYSREICKEVRDVLTELGVKCVIDYEADDMKGLNSNEELVKRVSIVNDYCKKYGADNVIYISIHVNAAGCSGWHDATGWTVYTTPGKTNSDALATKLYEAACEILNPLDKKIRTDWSDGDADKEANFYVIRKTVCPAVLTENFFQDCKTDVEWLQSEEGREAIADIHIRGILKYLNIPYSICQASK